MTSRPDLPAPGEDARGAGPASPLDGRAVAYFRFDTRREFLRVIALAVPLMLLGAVMATVAVASHQARDPAARYMGRATFQRADPPPEVEEGEASREKWLFVVGLGMVILSNVAMIGAMRRHLVRDRYMLLRADGLVRQVDDTWTLVAWDDVASVSYDAEESRVVLLMRTGDEHYVEDRLAGVAPEDFARLLRDVHRKAIWGNL